MARIAVSLFCILFFSNIRLLIAYNSSNCIAKDLEEKNDFQVLLQEIMLKTLEPYKCVVLMTDLMYADLFDGSWFERFGILISFLTIHVEESDDLLAPSNKTQESLIMAKNSGCQLYIILITNGIQITRFLRFGDKYRELDTLAKYILIYDDRLFDKKLFYLWRKIINVIFIRRYGGISFTTKKKIIGWYEITTVPFPLPISTILIPRRLDIWTQSSFRKGTDLFRDKTSDLQNQTLKITAFSHLPGTAKTDLEASKTVRAILSTGDNDTTHFSGVEVEILQTISKSMNFRCELYEPENADSELWGRKVVGSIYTGLIGEMVNSRADIALGDLYYTPYLLDLMDLSVPYNTECLTFLTPESLTDNSWKTLILPFKSMMWAAVIICLIISGIVFYILAHFHIYLKKTNKSTITNSNAHPANTQRDKKKKVITLSIYPKFEKIDPNTKYTLMKEQYHVLKDEDDPVGLYQFSEPINSGLYTYSMLLLVSLPKLPSGWSLRVLTGWYWLYCLLLATSYRASMTAILAKPTPRVTIDTLQELVSSRLTYGGWGEINAEFFKSSNDPTIRMIWDNFIMINNSELAVDRIAEATFAFYENTYFLKEASVKRQLRFQSLFSPNFTSDQGQDVKQFVKEDRSLHIMRDCVINMPISIGLQKNSPIKPRVDKFIRIVLEAGLIKKWLDDVMQKILNSEIQSENVENLKALMSMKKFSGGLVALGIGYFISIVTLIIEIVYFQYVVKKNPNFNKYSKRIEIEKSK